MKGLIVYKSNYGATRRYASWLSEALDIPAVAVGEVDRETLEAADLVIVGCPVMAAKPLLAGWLRKRRRALAGKRVVLFTTSGSAPGDPRLQAGLEASLPVEMRRGLRFFPFGGRMVFSELRPMDRFLMRIGQRIEKDPEMKRHMLEDVDRMDREAITPLVDHVRELASPACCR